MRTYRIEIRLIQLSVFLSVLVVIAGFLGLWDNKDQGQAAAPPGQEEPAPALENTKVVAIGDSFTFGYPGNTENSWPAVLGQTSQIEVVNKGLKSQTAQDLYSRFDADVLAEKPGRVIIFVGNGDAIKEVPLETFQQHIKAMVEKAESNHIIPILALPLPYTGVQNTIKEFREWESSYAKEKNILVLDFATVLMDADNVYLEGLLSKEANYPSKEGYKLMGEYASRVLD
ncbi:lysophospholipase L1-like esterase [Desulfitobacterium sp. LBE]|uniref:SGNH hydrolase-type esterase domain-containing protein n=4 Tax=root TaxID=1 RepID=Q24SF9_DESHY|nr:MULTISPECIES: SGNH/GDSL hydrolase family protein [Desulfitobacterium]ACL22416.1 lipolytic protein G-D-S-L family [Desulfitobacterium hafniense DCB-2]KTE92237.1 lysophospholipase [Desulfitobacterium hafniense]MEA5023963.1 SGNH/GDSL hydrolase family protein [Desulfitobacterium hafniense]TWH59800.1 lysophospholipase L1-like esterase [Desulfitobacterium sp. LBE]CDX03380.1 Lysophospholipase L1-like esterase [Desulfitobacterium hafniense]